MKDFKQLSMDYDRVEKAIRFLEANFEQQPALSEIANHIGLSEFHFQRLFSRWVGISPKRFLQFLTKEYAKKMLLDSKNVLDATFDSGLSSPGRLYDLFVACEALTPGEYKSKGEGLEIIYSFHPTPFGECLLAVTDRGICGLKFVQDENRDHLKTWLKKQWPKSKLVNEPTQVKPFIQQIFDFSADQEPGPLHLYVQGTNFQIKVWEALLRIPLGKAVTYEDIARHIGLPKASRAVGNAVGKNPIPFLIPCHRVIRKLGEFGNYGEGPARKKAILGWEATRAMAQDSGLKAQGKI
jgi:AraC family transcriptional regulator of adaptative response/methylated-DNA-[protein]-cysteine methyltransferase